MQPTIVGAAAIAEAIDFARRPGERQIAGIVGAPGAGKSFVAAQVCRLLPERTARVVPMDGFHLANDVLDAADLRPYKGRADTFDVAGFVHLLDRLRNDQHATVYAPRFVREIEESIAGAIPIEPDVDLVVVEGLYLLLDAGPWREVAPRLDVTFYLDTPEPVRLRRLLRRQRQTYGPRRGRRWVERVDLPNTATVEATKLLADFAVQPIAADGSFITDET